MLEPYDGKLSRTVLRGGVGSNAYLLPDYAMRQQTIESVFADAKEKHAMRYTHHRGLTAVTRWVKLKFAAMNLKKLAVWSWKDSFLLLLSLFPIRVFHKTRQNPCLAAC